MTDRSGVEIDYCPKCRGVWLDRGELDKIIERSQSHTSGLNSDRSDRRDDEDDYKYKKKKKGFLGDMFDF
jgi:Zn-finger nucleic acid-binding protein